MPTIHNKVTIASSPDDVWALLRDLTAVTEWVPGIAGARLDGTRRICTTVVFDDQLGGCNLRRA
jgi:carbon monoxide dehydrogenase subunit G